MPAGFKAPSAAEKKTVISKKKTVPEEIQEQILSKIPARKVAQFRLACKRWETLTATSHFITMHTKYWYKNFLSKILIEKEVPELHSPDNRTASSYSIQSKNQGSSAASSSLTAEGILSSYSRKMVSFSGLGFLVFRDQRFLSPSCDIVNPVTRERVKLMVMDEDAYLRGQVYAIFLHPRLQEICLLWGQRACFNPETTEFKLLNLKSALKTGNSCWKKIIPRLHNYIPRNYSKRTVPPVIFGNVLYWMIDSILTMFSRNEEISCEDSILSFDVEREEFQKLPHPGPYCSKYSTKHENMHLLQTNGEYISLCEFSKSSEFINTWERRSGRWIRKHRVKNHGLLRSSIHESYEYCFRVLGMVDEDLMLLVKQGTGKFCLVNLKHGSVEEMELSEDGLNGDSFVFAHTPTFAAMTSGSREEEVLVQVPTSVRTIYRRKGVIH